MRKNLKAEIIKYNEKNATNNSPFKLIENLKIP
jgi:hypothetical protein